MRSRNSWKSVIFAPVALVLFFGLVYAEDKAPFTGEINAKGINLRNDANVNSIVIATLDKGEQVEVVLEMYGWYKVRLPRKIPVYIKKSLVACIKSTEALAAAAPAAVPETAPRCLSAKLLGDRVNIRLKPSESAPIVGIADKAEVVNVISEAGDWYKIEPIQNSFGWVYKKFVNKVVVAVKPAQETPALKEPEGVSGNPEGLAVFTGKVEPYGMVFFRKATHKFITSDNKVFLLKGNRASLNALNYRKVKLVGKIISAPQEKPPVIEVKIIEVVS
ncbi:MAG: SH3 domain-containing protein [Candidatus Omnitrophica bacterium]|nr:SH3 domain-containing protein [Candidatus Omnitrophota bacterium]